MLRLPALLLLLIASPLFADTDPPAGSAPEALAAETSAPAQTPAAEAPPAAGDTATPAPPETTPMETPPPAVDTPAVPTDAAPLQPVPPAEPPAPAAPSAAAASAAQAQAEEQRVFDQYRHDLISLLALRTDADLLVAAAELAYADAKQPGRPAALKSEALLKRAQKFAPDSALVWWVSSFVPCAPGATSCASADASAKLQQLDGDNAAAWLPALHAQKDPAKARALLASMAQASRFNDFWGASVLAVYAALQILPVPADVLSHGLNATAARLNFASSLGGSFMPNYQRLGETCSGADPTDSALVGDCIAIAQALEKGGTFRSQAVGFSIEGALLPPGTARDVLRARLRANAWQKEKFRELSARFPREEGLAQIYVDLLREHGTEPASVTALLRAQHVATEPPQGWQPPDRSGSVPDALAHPGH